MDMLSSVRTIFGPITTIFRNLFLGLFGLLIGGLILFFGGFFLVYRLCPWRLTPDKLAALTIKFKPYDLYRWALWDFLTRKVRAAEFRAYGFTVFCGRQGSGKTISMVQYLEDIRREYPKCLIVTNFSYTGATHRMTDWRDLLEIRNGTDGVVFAIDEIHSEYSSDAWRDFPESLLSEISQQRKQRIKIVATSQVYSRVVKPIREQCFSVVACTTYLGRFTRNLEYDAAEYATSDTPYQVKKKCRPIRKFSFVQSNLLRGAYDTYEKIQRMAKTDFIPRHER